MFATDTLETFGSEKFVLNQAALIDFLAHSGTTEAADNTIYEIHIFITLLSC